MNKRSWILLALLGGMLGGCSNGLVRIDREVDDLVAEASDEIRAEVLPDSASTFQPRGTDFPITRDSSLEERPDTVNPLTRELRFLRRPADDADEVIRRLDGYAEETTGGRELNLRGALAYSVANSREFRFAQESYLLTALELLLERHLWGPRFFDTVSANILGDGDDGFFDTSLDIVNDLSVTQRLPYGGEVSARALARSTQDLHQRVSDGNAESADIILSARLPLLRGAGQVAREDLIQAERDMIYAARSFERFRRDFLFRIARDYLDLIVLLQRIEVAEDDLVSRQELEASQQALYDAGRATPFDRDEAENDRLEAIDRVNNAREDLRVRLDQFKARIGLDVESRLSISIDRIDVPVPDTAIRNAIEAAMHYRLDLQTERDQLADAHRAVENARNALLGDLDVTASVNLPTDRDTGTFLDFEPDDSDFQVGVSYGLPLDREIERIRLRQTQIGLARAEREYERFRDDVAINVRQAVRAIDSALFSLEIQRRNLATAENRQAGILADPARATVRQKSDAIDTVSEARNALDDAQRDVEVAVLAYLLETGQLRVDESGVLSELAGMELDQP